MNPILEKLLELGWYGIAVCAIAWLVKSVITSSLSKDVESAKIQIAAAHTRALEQFKAESGLKALEHEIRFRRIDDQIAKVLVQVYRRLLNLYRDVGSYIADIEIGRVRPLDEKFKAVAESNKRFHTYFFANRLYIPPKLFAQVRDCMNKLIDITHDFSFQEKYGDMAPASEQSRMLIDTWKAHREEASPMFVAIVDAFQERLGVEDSPPKASRVALINSGGKMIPELKNPDRPSDGEPR